MSGITLYQMLYPMTNDLLNNSYTIEGYIQVVDNAAKQMYNHYATKRTVDDLPEYYYTLEWLVNTFKTLYDKGVTDSTWYLLLSFYCLRANFVDEDILNPLVETILILTKCEVLD